MPPQPQAFHGRDKIVNFFATVPARGRLDLIQLTPTHANGHLAVAAYVPDDTNTPTAYGIMVLTIRDATIDTVTGFSDPQLFRAFALPIVAS